MRTTIRLVLAAGLGVGLSVAIPAEAATPKSYASCTALNKVYPHGVGKVGARDRTSGTPVRNFRVSNAVYDRNDGRKPRYYSGERDLDRDNDGIACEKRRPLRRAGPRAPRRRPASSRGRTRGRSCPATPRSAGP